MCDIQIFTGISVLISAFVLLSRGIQAYHWQLIVYIAWFSSTTHISAMTVLRSFLHKRRVETSVRFALMTCLLIMLVIAFIPTSFFDWPDLMLDHWHCSAAETYSPTICFFDILNGRKLLASLDQELCGDMTPPSNPATQTMALSLVLLIFGFVSRSIALFRPLTMAVHVYLRRPVSKRARQVLVWLLGSPKVDMASGQTKYQSGHTYYLKFLGQPLRAVFLSFRITADLVGSMLAEVRFSIRAVILLV